MNLNIDKSGFARRVSDMVKQQIRQQNCCKPAVGSQVLFLEQFVIGDGQPNTPLNNSTVYTNALITSGLQLVIEKNGYGTLVEGTDYDLSTNGFTLKNGRVFSTDEIYNISVYSI